MKLAERAIIGTLMKETYLIKETELKEEYFVENQHRLIFKAMKELNAAGKGSDMIALISKLGADAVGGANNLQGMQQLANVERLEEYAEIVTSLWKEREKLNILTVAASENWDIEKINRQLDTLNVGNSTDHSELSDLLAKGYETPWIEQTEIKGVTTGNAAIDRITGGLQKSDLIIIAARPSMGKTDLMLNWAREAGLAKNNLVIVFSLEMPEEKLVERFISSLAGIDRGKFKNPYKFFDEKDKKNWVPANQLLSTANIHFFDNPIQTVPEMQMKTRKLIHEYPNLQPVVFIDYLQIIKADGDHNKGNKNAEVGEITGALKNLAREFKAPVVCLSQLSRQVESRPDKRPMLSDLRDSGSIEQDADVIAFPYRNAYYTKDESEKLVEYIISKHRNGPTGTIMGQYDSSTGLFT